MKLTTTVSSVFALLSSLAISSAAGDAGVVSGRVVTDTGRPLRYASVALVKPGGLPSQSQSVSSDGRDDSVLMTPLRAAITWRRSLRATFRSTKLGLGPTLRFTVRVRLWI